MPKQTTIILFCIIFTAFTQASAFRIPDTEQTKCYDDKGNEIKPPKHTVKTVGWLLGLGINKFQKKG
ncbi:hypothetical protein QUF70_16830 [Desulfobacterales bacterium HSG17]|nr:hypothetical protein [Desulfobacterales bacterium HSG17]